MSMGFTAYYIQRALKVYEKTRGHDYNTERIMAIIVLLQNKDKSKKPRKEDRKNQNNSNIHRKLSTSSNQQNHENLQSALNSSNRSSSNTGSNREEPINKDDVTEPPFVSHMTMQDARKLKVYDKLDHRDAEGRFLLATVSGKRGSNLKIHYYGWPRSWDVWSDFSNELHRFAGARSISERPAHRFAVLKKGDFVDINPRSQHPGWKCGEIRHLDKNSGQIQVGYESMDKNYLCWAHLDDTEEIAEFTSKSGTIHQTQIDVMKWSGIEGHNEQSPQTLFKRGDVALYQGQEVEVHRMVNDQIVEVTYPVNVQVMYRMKKTVDIGNLQQLQRSNDNSRHQYSQSSSKSSIGSPIPTIQQINGNSNRPKHGMQDEPVDPMRSQQSDPVQYVHNNQRHPPSKTPSPNNQNQQHPQSQSRSLTESKSDRCTIIMDTYSSLKSEVSGLSNCDIQRMHENRAIYQIKEYHQEIWRIIKKPKCKKRHRSELDDDDQGQNNGAEPRAKRRKIRQRPLKNLVNTDLSSLLSPAPIHWKIESVEEAEVKCSENGNRGQLGRFRIKLKNQKHPIKEALLQIGARNFTVNELIDILSLVDSGERTESMRLQIEEELMVIAGVYRISASGEVKKGETLFSAAAFYKNLMSSLYDSCDAVYSALQSARGVGKEESSAS